MPTSLRESGVDGIDCVMAVHDNRDWIGHKESEELALTNLLKQIGLVPEADTAFEYTPTEEAALQFYASRGFFLEDEAIRAVAEKLSLEIFQPTKISSHELSELLDQPPLDTFSAQEWRSMRAAPLEMDNDRVLIAMADPLYRPARARMQFAFGRSVEVCIGTEDDILSILTRGLAQEDEEAVELIVRGNTGSKETRIVSSADTSTQFESTLKDEDPNAAPIVRLVNKILSRAISCNASDLHLTPRKSGLEVKARIDGIMQHLIDVPEELKSNVISRIKLLCGMDISERRRPQDGRLRINSHNGVKDLRISSVPSAHGENLVARILSSDVKATSFDDLGAPPAIEEQIKRSLRRGCKVNLVTGPTGSGKTSTLYTSLLHLHDNSRNIITLEDPIEYRIDGITQIQVNPKVQFGFAEGLRSILRQDPDVVLVGEIRDEETASISMKTAQTGHLVLSTLHTNSAAAAITRLLDLGVPSYLIASSLGSVLAQRLLRTLCPECSLPMTEEKRAEHNLPEGARSAVGCDSCRDTGYHGRVAVFSFIEVTDHVAEAIRLELGEEEIEKRAGEVGFTSLSDAALQLVAEGRTTLEEVERVVGIRSEEKEIFSPEQPSPSEIAPTSDSRGLFHQPKILLVEDDNDQREIYSSILESEMFEVATATDGREALEFLMKEAVDLVICDMMMPRLDGDQFVRILRSQSETESLPVLMLTAADSEQHELESLATGVDDFLSKTSSVSILLARVRRLLARAKTTEQGSHP
ncbi:Flp pilus assembly complex ATPase component TadA [bacterium]|nr:Flp pilus assembly complex ATPase component TadA [bacterium]